MGKHSQCLPVPKLFKRLLELSSADRGLDLTKHCTGLVAHPLQLLSTPGVMGPYQKVNPELFPRSVTARS